LKKTPLQRKTPLKAKTALKSNTTLKTNSTLKAVTPLRSNSTLKSNTALQVKTRLKAETPLKCKQKTAKKLKGEYFSIFTKDMNRCVITGSTEGVVPHHIFGSSRKALCEKYGFILPLRSDWHTVSSYSIHQDRMLDLKYKIACQEYYINVLHKTKEEWLNEFTKWWEPAA